MDNSTKPLDRLDKKILRELQINGRLSNVELASRVGLSATPCLERVRPIGTKWLYHRLLCLSEPKESRCWLVGVC